MLTSMSVSREKDRKSKGLDSTAAPFSTIPKFLTVAQGVSDLGWSGEPVAVGSPLAAGVVEDAGVFPPSLALVAGTDSAGGTGSAVPVAGDGEVVSNGVISGVVVPGV
jgi:hypothetical protein